MLSELRIENFAIIDELALEFAPGFNVLTGETGAGKSILVDALGMALGDKAHPDLVRTGCEESRIQAVFNGCAAAGAAFLEGRGIPAEEDGTLVIQRRISRGGRHQAWLNGSPVALGVLAEVGGLLVDIHGQHQHQTLLRTANHLLILDDFGGLAGRRDEFAALFFRLEELDRNLARASADRRELERQREFLAFQLREIEAAGLYPGEEEELERSRALMVNAEKISLLAGEALELVYRGEAAAIGQVETAAGRVAELAHHFPEAAALGDSLASGGAVLREVAASLEELARRAEYDPEEHNRVEERLALIGRLRRKYGGTAAEIMARGEALRVELAALERTDENREEWARERAEVLRAMLEAGTALTREREKAARLVEREAKAGLGELGMARAAFRVLLTPRLDPAGALAAPAGRVAPGERGLEEVEFLLSANPGEDPKPLARVASGGELSRIMLALKGALARVDRVSTLIFDEIDTGIGGNVARVVGRKLKQLSKERQVICVTHLAQIAGLADAHFTVGKETGRAATRVTVRRLGKDERVAEIARMMAGDKVTRAAVQHARELMEE